LQGAFDRRLSPETGMRHPALENEALGKISKLLKAAELLTGIPLFLADATGTILFNSERQHFCRDFVHRVCPNFGTQCQSFEKCVEGHVNGTRDLVELECQPLGLREIVVPVTCLGQPVLYIICGASARSAEQIQGVSEYLLSQGCMTSREDLQRKVSMLLPVIRDSEVGKAIEVVRGAASLVEDVLRISRERSTLDEITRIDAVGRGLLSKRNTTPERNPLDAMATMASELLHAIGGDACCLWSKDEERGKMFALLTSGLSEQQILRLPSLPLEDSLPGIVAKDNRVRIVGLSAAEGSETRASNDIFLDMGFKSLVCVPVRTETGTPAAISVYSREEKRFGIAEANLLEKLAPHVWEGIEKAEASRFIAAIGDVSKLLNAAVDTDAFYDSLAERIRRWLGGASCSIFVCRKDSDELCLKGTTGVTGDRYESRYKVGQGLTGWVYKNRRSLRVNNCEDKEELQAIDPDLCWSGQVRETVQDRLDRGAVRSFVASPVLVDDVALGVIRVCIASSSRPVFSHDDELLLECLSREFAAYLDRARRVFDEAHAILNDVFKVHQVVVTSSKDTKESEDGTRTVTRLAFDLVRKRYPNWKWINLRVPDVERKNLKFFVIDGGQQALENRIFPLKRGDSLGADCFIERNHIRCPDISAELRYKCPFDKGGAKSCYNLPLLVSGTPIGVLSVDSTKLDDFDEYGQRYLGLLASQLATAFTLASSISALRRADQEKQAHLEAMAHQLIAPLSAMRGHCENLLQGRTTPERVKITLASVEAQSRIAALTASNFGILADLLVGRSMIEKAQKSSHDVVRHLIDIARDYQPMSWEDEKKIHVSVRGENADLKEAGGNLKYSILAKYDPRSFAQVLVNVVENAVKYSDPFTAININVTESNEHVKIEVSSVGIRLAEEDKEKIFEREYRTPAARQKYPPGTGIGLPIARAIMTAHKGKITAKATDAQKRTTFIIELPL
jgi:signal transduction histidine kinase